MTAALTEHVIVPPHGLDYAAASPVVIALTGSPLVACGRPDDELNGPDRPDLACYRAASFRVERSRVCAGTRRLIE
jgi:hypothetical protein